SEKIKFREGLRTVLEAIPPLSLIVIVVGGIIFGIFTPTEGAAVAVLCSFILMLFYKTLSFKLMPKILIGTANTTGIIMFLIGASSMIIHIFTVAGIPSAITDSILNITDNKYLILLMILLILLFVGTFMDIAPAVLVFTPIFLPIAQSLSMYVVQFCIVITFAMCIVVITPPVGNILFVGSAVSKINIENLIKPLLPFYVVTILVLILITFIPQLSL